MERNIEEGMLYLCATPIGNLEDITYRVLETLKKVDLIGAEDTRHSIKLLNHFEIRTPMTSYHEYNKVEKAKYLVEQMKQGKQVALITDAGTPGISDPGEELVRQCIQANIRVTSLPGPVACITALTMSGLATKRFAFEAFLPSDKKERGAVVEELKRETRTIILYEAPHHLKKTLGELAEVLGADRKIALCRELTKRYEEARQSTLGELCENLTQEEIRGEYVLVIEGKSVEQVRKEKQEKWENMSMEEHMAYYENQGIARKEAMKLVGGDRGISKRDVYQYFIEQNKG